MKRIAVISFVCAISLAWVSRSEAQTLPHQSGSSPTKALPPKSAPVKKSSGFKCAPSDPEAHGEDFPSNLQKLVEDKTASPQDRLDILACIATHEHDRRVQAEQQIRLALIELAAGQERANGDSAKVQNGLKNLHDAVLALAVAQTPAVGQTPENDVGMLKIELEKVKNTVTQLCSAIRYSLVMNGTSASSTGAPLWSACN